MNTPDGARTSSLSRGLPAQLLHPPVRETRFWIAQAGVVTFALLHDVVLVAVHAHDLAGVPAPTTSALLLIPVIYAALNFGVLGAVGTALWATVLVVPHWFVADGLTASHVSIEVGYLLVLNGVAVVVGQRVEQEQKARLRAEDALLAARNAESRYYALFEDQPSPVLIADAGGAVVEANTAATQLFGKPTAGQHLTALLGVDVGTLLAGHGAPLTLVGPDGSDLLVMPTAHELGKADGAGQVQIVLSDITEQHRRHEEQRRFAGRLLDVQEHERKRLARELHDDPLQHLTYLSRTLDELSRRRCSADELGERLTQAASVADEAATALRKTIQGLRPPVLDDLGLVSALRQLTEDTRARTEATVVLKVTGTPERLGPDLELITYRVAQEALTNVVRHSHASSATIRLAVTDSQVELTVTDDGAGIGDAAADGGPATRLGLIGMRERVSLAGGTLEVSPRRPHGTRLHAKLPLLRAEAATLSGGAPQGGQPRAGSSP